MALVQYENKEFGGKVIRQRVSDGYLNATDMCKANDKLYSDWYRLERTEEYLKELSSDMGQHISQLVEVRKGNSKKYQQGTWVHPYVAANLAQWLSPKFAVFVSKLVIRYINGDPTLIEEIKQNNKLLQDQVQQLRLKEQEQSRLIEEKVQALEEKDAQLNRLHNIQKELLSYKKRVTKNETIYIVSTADYARQGIYKIGRTKTQMKFRSAGHNNTHVGGDKVKVLREFKVNDCVLVEKNIHTKLSGLALEGETEFFLCPYNLLESVVDLIIINDENENDLVNKVIDAVFKLKQNTIKPEDWMEGLDPTVFNDQLLLIEDSKVEAKFDFSDPAQKQTFIHHCIQIYNDEYKDQKTNQIIWKEFQKVLIQQLKIPKSHFKVKDWKDELQKADAVVVWRARK